jgi:hypothetical protein
MVGVKLGVLVTEAEAEVVTETENFGDPVAKELPDGSEEILAVDV